MHELEGKTIKDVAPLCDVVISGVPGEKYKFDTSLLREGAVCVNFSSEKVSPLSSLNLLRLLAFANVTAELPPRSPRKGIHLRAFHRKGDHRRLAAQPVGE